MVSRVRAAWIPALAAAVALLPACGAPGGRPGSTGAGTPQSVLIVSIDTCRADRLGCYGFGRATTPEIDAIAAGGVRFSRALSPVPLTLPAHASLLTGTTPPAHGVRGNATYRLSPDNVTLGEILGAHGYATAAFVSAFVLDSRFGLAQGFDLYDDVFAQARTTNVVTERRGAETTGRALAWLREHANRPFFLFVHYYDPHMLYEPPEPFASRFADDPYAGEIAYADAQVGEIVAELKRLGLYESTWIVVTSDHGEMLGEHGEPTHGWFVYESAIRVPLIVRGPGLAPAVAGGLAGLIDVAPTVLGLLGLSVPAGMEGENLAAMLRGEPPGGEPRELYCESIEATRYGGNPLFALAGERFKYVETTRPELYDLTQDPAEERDLAAREPDRAAAMSGRLGERLRDARGAAAPLDEESRRRIEALGYVASSAPSNPLVEPGREDPKDLLGFHLEHLSIPPLVVRGELAEARRRSEELVARRPGFTDGHLLLARIARDEGRLDEAIDHYRKALELRPGMAGVRADLGVVLAATGRSAAAIDEYERSLALDPDRVEALNNLGNALLSAGRTEEALARYLRAVELRPDSAETQLNAGLALLRLGRKDEARLCLARAEAAGSRDPATLETLATALAALD